MIFAPSLLRRPSYAAIEVARDAGRKASTGNHEARSLFARGVRRKRIEIGAPFALAQSRARQNEPVLSSGRFLKNREILPRLFRDRDGKSRNSLPIKKMPQQLAKRSAHCIHRRHIAAEPLHDASYIDPTPARIAPRKATAQLVERSHSLDGGQYIDRRVDGEGDDVCHFIRPLRAGAFDSSLALTQRSFFPIRRLHPRHTMRRRSLIPKRPPRAAFRCDRLPTLEEEAENRHPPCLSRPRLAEPCR